MPLTQAPRRVELRGGLLSTALRADFRNLFPENGAGLWDFAYLISEFNPNANPMIRHCFFLIFAVLPFCGLQAQDTAISPRYPGAGRFEGEVAVGATFGYASLGSFDNDAAGFCLVAESRYNFRRTPFDVGLRLGGSCYSRLAAGVCSQDPFMMFSLMAVADYNLHLTPKVALFAGAGIGGAYVLRTAEGAVSDTPSSDCAAFCVMPRVGCECWNRLRVTLGYMCTERANRHLSLTFGIAIGGSSRR